MERRFMTNGMSNAATAPHRCWSCKAEVAATDKFCRHCGAKLHSEQAAAAVHPPPHPSNAVLHERLVAIEKLLLKTIVGVLALLLLVGWIALQLYHFGRI
jgi:predicted amidophosphoribosyltransferase